MLLRQPPVAPTTIRMTLEISQFELWRLHKTPEHSKESPFLRENPVVKNIPNKMCS